MRKFAGSILVLTISYKPSERPKIEGKRLAKSLEYDFKKKR